MGARPGLPLTLEYWALESFGCRNDTERFFNTFPAAAHLNGSGRSERRLGLTTLREVGEVFVGRDEVVCLNQMRC